MEAIGIRTEDFQLAYRLIKKFRDLNIPHIQLDHRNDVPSDINLWFGSNEEINVSADYRGVAVVELTPGEQAETLNYDAGLVFLDVSEAVALDFSHGLHLLCLFALFEHDGPWDCLESAVVEKGVHLALQGRFPVFFPFG